MKRFTISAAFFFLAALFAVRPVAAQSAAPPPAGGPVAGSTYTLVYNPPKSVSFAEDAQLTLMYVFDFWNIRYGTRLALWQNVLLPDTSRVRFAPLVKQGTGWTADIAIPPDAALLSYIVSDGKNLDGNAERTYVTYVLGQDGTPVRNARYYSIPFLKMAREEIGVQIREAEREVVDYPDNFRAYHQYFQLLLEQGKGSPRTQERIINRLQQVEQRFGGEPGFLNLMAETWYYVLQDHAKGIEYRNMISPSNMWPQVFSMVNRSEKADAARERVQVSEQRRNELLGSPLPAFNLRGQEGEKVALPRDNGTASVLVFWASTSERSKEMLRALRAITAELGPVAIDVITANLDLEEAKGVQWFEEEGLPFELLFNQGSALQMLGIDSIPVAFVLDDRNVVRDIIVGYSSYERGKLKEALQGALQN